MADLNYLEDPEDDRQFRLEMARLIADRSDSASTRLENRIRSSGAKNHMDISVDRPNSIPSTPVKFILVILAAFAGAWSACSLFTDSLVDFLTGSVLASCAMGGFILIDHLDKRL